jgi:hypothetical protein
VCQCALGGRISITVLPVPGTPNAGTGGAGLEAEGAALGRQQAARQQAQDDEAHAFSGKLKEASGGLAVFGLVCLAAGLVFPPAAVVGAVALELSEAALVVGVAVDVAVAIDHPTQDNWVTVGGDALAIATGYVVGKVIIGPALGAVARKLAQREARLAAAEAEAALAAEAKQASAEAGALKAAAAKAQAELEQDLVAASKKRADDLVSERERIKQANEGVKPKKQEPQTVSSPVTAAIADPKMIDPVTGKPIIYHGENFKVSSAKGYEDYAKFKEDAHPVLKARIEQQETAFKEGLELKNPRSGSTPGAHAEVIAVDKALKAREAAGLEVNDNTISELYLHNRSLLNNQYPNGTPKMCDHCASILKGINTIGHE